MATTVTQPCLAYPQNSLAGGPQGAPTDFSFTTTGPDDVLVGETFNLTLQLAPIEIPTTNSGYSINNLGKVFSKIPDPTNVIVNTVTLGATSTPGWVMSRAGGVTTVTNNNTFSPNPAPQVINVPLITYNVTANAPINNSVEMRLGGAPTYNDSSNPSTQFTINLGGTPVGNLDVILKCFAPGTPPASVHSTAIVPPDTTGPGITVTRPANGASYAQGQSVSVAFSCSDPSGVASCVGSQPNGSAIDTTTPGNYTFTVNAVDNKGNPSSTTVSYAVVNLPVVQIHGGTRTESGGPVPFTVTLTKPANAVVDLTTQDGSATAADDYDAQTPSLTFTSGGPLTQTVNVTLKDDTTAEDAEDFSLVATSTSGDPVAIGTSSAARVIDDDQGGDIATSCGSATEGNAVTCTLRLLRAPNVPTTVTYSTSNATASAPADFTSTSGSLTFNPGVYPLEQTVSVPTNTDAVYEGDYEQFGFSATVTGGGTDSASGVIAEATTIPAKLYIQDLTVKETNLGGSTTNNVRVRMTLDKPATGPVTVSVCTQNGTATTPSDYTKKCPPPMTFQTGQIWKELAIGIVPDNTVEPDESFNVKMFNLTGPALMGDDTGVITIIDDDATPSSTTDVSVADASVWEGDVNGTASNVDSVLVNISLSKPLSVPVVLNWQAVALPPGTGAATKNEDFRQSTLPGTYMGSVKIGAGARTAQAKVDILPDSQQEGSEAFRVFVFERNIASYGLNYVKDTGFITLLDDDPLTPGAPTNLAGTPSTAKLGAVDLTWTAPGNDGGSAVTDYEYRVSTDLEFDTETWAPTGAGRRTSMTGIPCGTTCRVQLRAVNAAGQGVATNSNELTGFADTTAPDVSLNSPVSGSNVDKFASLTFAGDAGIDATDSAGVTVKIYSGTDTSGSLVRTLSTTATTGEFSVGTTPLAAGIYTAQASQSDWAANTGLSNTVTFEVHDAIFVAPTGNDANAGTAAAPKLTVAAAITAAGANGELVVGFGSYAEASGGIAPSNNQVIKGGYNEYNGWTRPGTAGVGGKPNPLDTSVSAIGQAMLVSGAKTVTVDGLSLNGLNTGLAAGSSVYGVRAISGANVSLTNVSVSAQAGIAAAASSAVGTTGGTGCTGNNNSGNNGGASCNSAVTNGRRAGAGGNRGGLFASGASGQTAGCGTGTSQASCAGAVTNPEVGGAGGAAGNAGILCISPSNASGGGGGLGGLGGTAGASAANDVSLAGVTYVGKTGGTSAAGIYGRGGGGGGGGGCNGNGGGAGGGGGLDGGGAVAGGAAGGGSFGVYAFNASVTLSGSTVSASAGGAGGKGGTGGTGGNGGNGGSGGGTRGGGGGGGGGAGGGGGGGGGAGGPSIAVFQAGTGSASVASSTLARDTTPAAGGAGGTGGTGGNPGTGGGGASSGAVGGSGGTGSTGLPGNTGLLCSKNIGGVCTA